MNLEQVTNLLEGVPNVDPSRFNVVNSSGQEWLMMPCPLARRLHQRGTDRNLSFGISLGDVSFFHCFSCKSKGKFERLLSTISELEGVDLDHKLKEAEVLNRETVASILNRKKVQKERLILSENALIWPPASLNWVAMDYLESRGIDYQMADFWDLRFDDKKEMIVFPVRTMGLRGAVGRSVHEKKFHNYFGFHTNDALGGYDKLEGKPKILLVEAFFDLINARKRAIEHGFDVVATFTSECCDYQLELIDNTDADLYIGYDMDKAGDEGAKKIIERKPAKRFKWDSSVKDFGEMTEEQLDSIFSLKF